MAPRKRITMAKTLGERHADVCNRLAALERRPVLYNGQVVDEMRRELTRRRKVRRESFLAFAGILAVVVVLLLAIVGGISLPGLLGP